MVQINYYEEKDYFTVNGKIVQKDMNGNYLAIEELTSSESKAFREYLISDEKSAPFLRIDFEDKQQDLLYIIIDKQNIIQEAGHFQDLYVGSTVLNSKLSPGGTVHIKTPWGMAMSFKWAIENVYIVEKLANGSN